MIFIKQEYEKLFAGFKSVDDFLRIEIDVVRKFKNRTTGRFEISGQGFYIKKHFPCGAAMVLNELIHLRKPQIGAIHEKDALEKLHSLGIETMSMVAFGQDGNSAFRQKSFIVTRELANVTSLEDICRNWPVNPPPSKFKHDLINHVALIAKKMHDSGMNHRDFYICHFLLDTTGGAAKYEKNVPRLLLIDLHRAQIRTKLPFRWRVKDIGGLYFSAMDIGLNRNDIYRFIRAYTGKSLCEAFREDSIFWKSVLKRAIKTYRKEFGKSPAIIIE